MKLEIGDYFIHTFLRSDSLNVYTMWRVLDVSGDSINAEAIYDFDGADLYRKKKTKIFKEKDFWNMKFLGSAVLSGVPF